MKSIILDSYALISYLNKEQGYPVVAEIFEKNIENEDLSLVCVVNLGEVYYHALRVGGKEKAQLVLDIIKVLPVEIVDADTELTLMAAEYKAFNKMSYADAYAAALTKMKKGSLVTGDKEFKALENEFKIVWM
jgi:predicted nucleic acid-binding protein